jgi:multisubunit Na+/H+ antiporter MnhB subunit
MDPDKKDIILRRVALISGAVTAVLFIVSLIAFIEFPSLFKPLAWGMIAAAIVFLVFRSAFNYRNTFKVKSKK